MKLITLFFALVASMISKAQNDSLAPYVYKWNKLEPKKEETRIRRHVMNGSTTALSNLEVHISTLQAGKAPHPPHVHDDAEELIIVKDGQVKITIKDKTQVLGPGSIAFAMSGDEHGIENAGNKQATYYILKYKSKQPMNIERAKSNGGSFMLIWESIQQKKTEKGYRKDFFNRPTSQLEKFEMHTTALNEGLDSHAQHTHTEEEIILILRGNVTMHIGNEFHKAGPGDIVFLPSLIPHALKNTGKGQCEYFAFQWSN